MIPERRRQQLAEAQVKHYNSVLNWATRIKNKALQRSKKNCLGFDLDRDFIFQKLLVGTCEVTGIPFDLTGGERKPHTPSIDRIDPSRGYTKDNVQLVVWIYNAAKSTFTHSDVMYLATTLSKEINEH